MAPRTLPETVRPDSVAGDKPFTLVAPRRSVAEHLGNVWRYRELLVALVRKELKVKYKNSSLGFAWSLLNPLLYLVIYYYVFQVMLGSGIPSFPIFLLSGLLVWNLFATAVSSGVGAIVSNAPLVKKVNFPREVLPLAGVGAALVHFVLQFMVLLGALIAFRWSVDPAYVWLVLPALVVTLVLGSALGVLLSAANVYARDTEHLLELVLLMWFWLTPIVYPFRLVADKLAAHDLSWLPLLNPMVPVTLAFQRAVYGHVDARGLGESGTAILPAGADAWWYLRNLAVVGLLSGLLLIVAVKVFDRVEGSFSEAI